MPFIPALDVDRPPTDAASTNEQLLPDASHLAELRGIVGHFPDGLGALDQMYERMVGQGRLDQTVRLTIIAASARWRSDDYVAAAMFNQALREGCDAGALGALIDEAEGPQPTSAEAVLLAFCRKVTETPYKTIQRDIDTLRDHGWTTGQIVEAVTMISLSGYMSVMSAAGGLPQTMSLEAEPWR